MQPTDSARPCQCAILCGSRARHAHHPVHRIFMVVDTHLRMLYRGDIYRVLYFP